MWDLLQKIANKHFPKLSFSRTLAISFTVHVVLFLFVAMTIRPTIVRPPSIDPAKVVWTQTVKQKKKTPKNKLPPPDVSRVKLEKKKVKKVNIDKKKEKPKKKEKIDRKKLLADALAKIKEKVNDDRPTPKDDNFESGKDQKMKKLSSDEADALKASAEMYAYTESMHTLVVDNFLWYQSEKQYITKIEIQMSQDGSIEKMDVLQSSGNTSFDQATIRALEKSSPFPTPPATLAPLFLQETIVFTFDGSQL